MTMNDRSHAPDVINLTQKFGLVNEHWSPKIAGELNDSYLKLVKLQGEFVWHQHEREDELFLIVRGTLRIQLRDRELTLHEGEFTIIPRGVEHRPVADEEVWAVLLEPKTTLNTGDAQDERTVTELERI